MEDFFDTIEDDDFESFDDSYSHDMLEDSPTPTGFFADQSGSDVGVHSALDLEMDDSFVGNLHHSDEQPYGHDSFAESGLSAHGGLDIEAECQALQDELEQKCSALFETDHDVSESAEASAYLAEDECHPTFGAHKDNLYTKSEIESHKHEVQNEIDYQKSRIHHLKNEIRYEANHGNSNAKLSSLGASLRDAERDLASAKADLKAWENTKPKKG